MIHFEILFITSDDGQWSVGNDLFYGRDHDNDDHDDDHSDEGGLNVTNLETGTDQYISKNDPHFGRAFSLSRSNGDYLAVGCRATNTVYVYQRQRQRNSQGEMYVPLQTITNKETNGMIGTAVALSSYGTLLVVSAPYRQRTKGG